MSEKLWTDHLTQNKNISEHIALMEQADQVDEAQALQLLILNQANLIAIHAHLQAMVTRKRIERTVGLWWLAIVISWLVLIFR